MNKGPSAGSREPESTPLLEIRKTGELKANPVKGSQWMDLTKGGLIPSEEELLRTKTEWKPSKDWKPTKLPKLRVNVTIRAADPKITGSIKYEPKLWLPFASVVIIGDAFHQSWAKRQSCFKIIGEALPASVRPILFIQSMRSEHHSSGFKSCGAHMLL
jgi:hypothetical protein